MDHVLRNIRVLELSQLLPGALCTRILADFGAEVIKIEPPHGGDAFRQAPPIMDDMGAYFRILNRNKQSVTINIKKPEGRDLLVKLIPTADVIVESFRPGTMDKLGLSYKRLAAINPRLIYCALTGFGQDGPESDQPSHDINLLALSGILGLTGTQNGPPVVPSIQIAGVGGALQAALGITMGLLGRERSGMGCYLDVAILDCLTPFLSLVMAEQSACTEDLRRGETRVGGGAACYNVYETKDGRWLALGCLEEKFWVRLCDALGLPALASELHAPPARQEEMIACIRRIFLTKDRDEWVAYLKERGVVVSPVHTLKEALLSPQIVHRRLWYQGGDGPEHKGVHQRNPLKYLGHEHNTHVEPPRLGEHTRTVFSAVGIGEGELSDLEARGII